MFDEKEIPHCYAISTKHSRFDEVVPEEIAQHLKRRKDSEKEVLWFVGNSTNEFDPVINEQIRVLVEDKKVNISGFIRKQHEKAQMVDCVVCSCYGALDRLTETHAFKAVHLENEVYVIFGHECDILEFLF